MNEKPQICYVCSRLCYLRCFDCDTPYCSTKCKIDDWEDHEIRLMEEKKKKKGSSRLQVDKNSVAFKMMEKYFTKEIKEGVHVSVQDRLMRAVTAAKSLNGTKENISIKKENVAPIKKENVAPIKKEEVVADEVKIEPEIKDMFDYSPYAKEILKIGIARQDFKTLNWSSDEEDI